jgi:hypothetical protein
MFVGADRPRQKTALAAEELKIIAAPTDTSTAHICSRIRMKGSVEEGYKNRGPGSSFRRLTIAGKAHLSNSIDEPTRRSSLRSRDDSKKAPGDAGALGLLGVQEINSAP